MQKLCTLWCLVLIICCYSSFTAAAQTISGQVQHPLSFQQNGQFISYPVKLKIDSYFNTTEYNAIPNQAGEFVFEQLSLNEPTPAFLIYAQQEVHIWLNAEADLHLQFASEDVLNTLEFTGALANENQALLFLEQHYTGLQALEKINMRKPGANVQDIAAYHQYLNEESAKARQSLKKYQQINSTFATWAAKEVMYLYAFYGIQPYFKTYAQASDGLAAYIKKYNLQDTEALNSTYYIRFLEYYLRNLAKRDPAELRAERQANNTPWIIRGYNLAGEKLQGKTKETMQAKLVLDMILAEQLPALQIGNELLPELTQPHIKNSVQIALANFEKNINKPLPNNTFLNDSATSLQAILEQHKGKVVYVDIWGSWCGPCLRAMPKNLALQKEFNNSEVVFVFIAIDDTKGAWRSKIGQYAISGYHYLASKDFNNKLKELFNIRGVPRYLIFNKTGKLVDDTAPSPASESIKTRLRSLL